MKPRDSRGIIKTLVVLVVGMSVLFLTLGALATYIKPRAGGTFPSLTTGLSGGSVPRQNSLIDFGTTGSTRSNTTSATDKNRSLYANQVSLSKGNVNTAQPYEEYVTIRNTGTPVNITGWTLTNSKGTRPVQNSQNSYFYPSADVAIIGQGTEFLDPSGKQSAGNIVLKKGDIAYVVTGGPFNQYSFPIPTSFKENMCTGYLKVYPFNPSLTKSCPYIKNDPQINTVTDQCYDYMARLSRCEDPQKEDKKKYDLQTTQCKNFMAVRLNYPSCVALNRYDKAFTLNKWRIFLGKGREMWASRRDTITLYDNKGLVVDQVSY